RDGTLEGDDEVAIWHGGPEDGYQPLSEPLVNIRVTLAAAVSAGVLSPAEERALIDFAKAAHYPSRSFRSLLGGEAAARLSAEKRWFTAHWGRRQGLWPGPDEVREARRAFEAERGIEHLEAWLAARSMTFAEYREEHEERALIARLGARPPEPIERATRGLEA